MKGTLRTTDLKDSKMPDNQQKAPLWFRSLAVFSYVLLFVGFLVVFSGGVYILFFVDPLQVAPDSLDRDTPILEKLGFLGGVLLALAIGYLINRRVWGPFLRLFQS